MLSTLARNWISDLQAWQSVDVYLLFAPGVQTESPELQIEAAARQPQSPRRLRNVAVRLSERFANQVALDLFDGAGQRLTGGAGFAQRPGDGRRVGKPRRQNLLRQSNPPLLLSRSHLRRQRPRHYRQ